MTQKLKKGDFIEIDYDGYTKEENFLFDSTDAKKMRESGTDETRENYNPVIICIGEGQILPAIDSALIGMALGEEKRLELAPESAFGKKEASLLKIVPMTVFKKEKIAPHPGLQVSVDGMMGVVKTASGGRVIVDFNHPLAGKDVHYSIKPKRMITDINEKVSTYISFALNIPRSIIGVKADGNKVELKAPFKLPNEVEKKLEEAVKKAVPELEALTFVEEKRKEAKKDAFGRDPGHEHYGHNHG